MGFLNLAGFQQELVGMIGQGGPGLKRGNTRLTRMINLGYYELTGTQEFKALFDVEVIATIADTKTYVHGTNTQSVRGVIDTTNKRALRRVSIENFFRLDPATTGQPTRWAREGGSFYFWPIPDAIFSMNILRQKEPTVLALDTDTTVLNAIWDQAILLLAAKAVATIDNDPDKVSMYTELARLYIGTRIGDQGADAYSQSVGVDVAQSEDMLTELE